MSKIRLTHGLHWRGNGPRPGDYRTGLVRTGVALAVVGGLWLTAMTLDAREGKEKAVVGEAEIAEILAACLNGDASWVNEEKTLAVRCRQAEEFKL